MRMYHFDNGDYVTHYFVMAASPEEALEAVKSRLKSDSDEEATENPHTRSDGSQYDFGYAKEIYDLWKDVTIDTLPDGFQIEEFGQGQVEWAERS